MSTHMARSPGASSTSESAAL